MTHGNSPAPRRNMRLLRARLAAVESNIAHALPFVKQRQYGLPGKENLLARKGRAVEFRSLLEKQKELRQQIPLNKSMNRLKIRGAKVRKK